MSLREIVRQLVAWLERGRKRWQLVRALTKPMRHESHRRIRKRFITETLGLSPEPSSSTGMSRRIEIWRPVTNLREEQLRFSLCIGTCGGVQKALIDVDDRFMDFEDLIVDGGLNALCGQAFDGSGSRPAVFDYVAIGTSSQAPSNGDTALIAEVMRIQGTYSKDANLGECSVDATFNIEATYALNECGLLNAATNGTLFCRDTYTTKNVVSGDTVKVYYTPKFQRV